MWQNKFGVIGKWFDLNYLSDQISIEQVLVFQNGSLSAYGAGDIEQFRTQHPQLIKQAGQDPGVHDYVSSVIRSNNFDLILGLVASGEEQGIIDVAEAMVKAGANHILFGFNIREDDSAVAQKLLQLSLKWMRHGINLYASFYDIEEIHPALFPTVFTVAYRSLLASLASRKIGVRGVDFVFKNEDKTSRRENMLAASRFLSDFSLQKFQETVKANTTVKVLPLNSQEVFCLAHGEKIAEEARKNIQNEGEWVMLSFDGISSALIQQLYQVASLAEIDRLGVPFRASVTPVLVRSVNVCNWLNVLQSEDKVNNYYMVFLTVGVARRIVARSRLFQIRKSEVVDAK